jgi:hypothetical protein
MRCNLADCVRIDTRTLAAFRVFVGLLIVADLLLELQCTLVEAVRPPGLPHVGGEVAQVPEHARRLALEPELPETAESVEEMFFCSLHMPSVCLDDPEARLREGHAAVVLELPGHAELHQVLRTSAHPHAAEPAIVRDENQLDASHARISQGPTPGAMGRRLTGAGHSLYVDGPW